MKTKWHCSKCKTVMTFDVDVAEQEFMCSHCGNRWLLPVVKEEEEEGGTKDD